MENGTRAVVVIENGVVTMERYSGAGSATRGEFLASGTKSFTCALAAAAEDDGFLSIDDLASTGIAPWRSGGIAPDNGFKQQIRAVNLLSLSSGLSNSGQSGEGLNSIDSYAQAMNARSSFGPDVATIYGPNSFQAFAAFFELRTGGQITASGDIVGGRDPLSYLQSRVFDRIGIAPTAWLRDVKGKPNFGGGASFRASDWARYGQFILQNGQWNGNQILSASRIQRCRTYENPAFRGYGLSFFSNRRVGNSYQPSQDSIPFPQQVRDQWLQGGNIAPAVPESMMMAYGAGNMKMFILPSHNAVVVKLSGSADDNQFLGLLIGTLR
jgi:CubicO group peptidase (beta-lactamase class C family)